MRLMEEIHMCDCMVCERIEMIKKGENPYFVRELNTGMALVSEAVFNAFKPDKLNYSLLGAGRGLHMHWHIHPRRNGDTPTPGPVWQLGKKLFDKKYNPTSEELEILKKQLNEELDKLLDTTSSCIKNRAGI